MNAHPPLSAPPGPAGERLHTRRCSRHPEREAAARCPACGGFFCRECVVEHEGRLLCSACLAREAGEGLPGKGRWPAFRGALELAAAAGAAWLVFYALGSLLLSIPPAFHEGTIWGAKAGDGP